LTASLLQVPIELVESVWIKAIPHFKRGEKYWKKYYDLGQLQELILSGRQQLWIIIEGSKILYVITTQIDDYPAVRSLRVCYLGGEGLGVPFMPLLRKIEKWGKEQGCTMSEFTGRPEWERLLKKACGYEMSAKVYRKELT